MTEPDGKFRYALPLIIFFSGFAALTDQLVWIREFSLLFGTHLLSTSTVLTVFMAGLSAGALLFGRQADRATRPVWLLFIIQAGIALFAFLFLPLFHFLTRVYAEINQSGGWLSGHPDICRFLLSALLLIIPTTLMGGTMPVMVKLYTDNLKKLGTKIGALYAFNNSGALAGGFLAGFFLIRLIGSHGTLMLAATLSTLNALVILALSKNVTPSREQPAAESPKDNITIPTVSAVLLKIILVVTGHRGVHHDGV